MQVKIVKCSSDKYWYANRIGEVFNVDLLHSFYKVENIGFIDADDTDSPIQPLYPISIGNTEVIKQG